MKMNLKKWLFDQQITQANMRKKLGWDASKASKIVNGNLRAHARDIAQIMEFTDGQIGAKEMAEIYEQRQKLRSSGNERSRKV